MSDKARCPDTISSSLVSHDFIFPSDRSINESTIVLWFDSNLISNDDIQQIKTRLSLIDIYPVFHIDLEQCFNYIQSIDKEKIFLIISDVSASEILPRTIKFCQIDVIFIISAEESKFEYLKMTYPKIVGIYSDMEPLCMAIQEEIDFNDEQLLTFILLNPDKISAEYISKESAKFLWSQLFMDILLHLPDKNQTLLDMIDIQQQYYYGTVKEQKAVDEIKRGDQSSQAIRWYLKRSFNFKLITKALKLQDFDRLHAMRFFMHDLTNTIVNEHKKVLLSNEPMLTVYRGGKITKKELQKLKENQGGLISINSYLLASRLQSSALSVAMKPTRRTDAVSVIFKIECNIRELGENISFADVAQYSEYPDREEVLFDIKATFRLKTVRQIAHIWVVKMYLTHDGQQITKDYLEAKYLTTEEKSTQIVFGRLMCTLGQHDNAQKFFEHLLNNDFDEEALAWIEFNLGRTLDLKNEWKMAKSHYTNAYKRMMNMEPVRWKSATYILNKLGIILYNQGKYDQALDYYQKAMKIQTEYSSSDCIDNARILGNIALILNIQGKYEEALNCYKQALALFEYFSSSQADIAQTLNNIGNILYEKGNYIEAISHYEQVLKMHDNLNQPDHIYAAPIFNNIGLVSNIQGKYDDALKYCQHSLNIYRTLYSSDHLGIASVLNNIGVILYNSKNYENALDYHRQALRVRRKYYPRDHIDNAESLNNIGNILYQQSKYKEALDYYFQTLEILEKFYSPCHVNVALCLSNIGCVLHTEENHDEALHYYQHALKIQQKLYTYSHPDIASTMNNIANILYQQNNYKEALDYHLQALEIRQKFYPSDHIDIGDSLNNIEIIHDQMRQSKMSQRFSKYFSRLRISSTFPT